MTAKLFIAPEISDFSTGRPVPRTDSIAMDQAGIRPSQKSRRVGDYILGQLLYESPTGTYQEIAPSNALVCEHSKMLPVDAPVDERKGYRFGSPKC